MFWRMRSPWWTTLGRERKPNRETFVNWGDTGTAQAYPSGATAIRRRTKALIVISLEMHSHCSAQAVDDSRGRAAGDILPNRCLLLCQSQEKGPVEEHC